MFIGCFYIFKKCLFRSFASFLHCVVFFLLHSKRYQIYDLQIFLPFCGLAFHILDCVLGSPKVFNLEVQCIYSIFLLFLLLRFRDHLNLIWDLRIGTEGIQVVEWLKICIFFLIKLMHGLADNGSQRHVHVLIPRASECYLFGEKVFVDIIKLRFLQLGDSSRLSRWALKATTRALRGEGKAKGGLTHREGGGGRAWRNAATRHWKQPGTWEPLSFFFFLIKRRKFIMKR